MADNQLFDKYGHVIPAGEVIFREGEDGDEMFIIQDGKVRISKTIGDKEHILAILGKGDFFGEMAIVTRIKRSATARTVAATHLLAFDRQGFRGMIEKNSKIAMNIIDKLCRRLQHANMQIQHIKRRDEPTLVALNLLYAFEGAADSSALPEEKTIEEISLALEAPAAEVRGIVEKLAAGGVILRERGVIRLADMEKLRLAAESAAAGPEPAAE